MESWRLISDPARDGAHNMAVDHAILDAVIDGSAPPTVRLYAWSPHCLSLGIGQSAHNLSRDRLWRDGITLTRRPTGGRAVLHADELTYSIALPPGHPLGAGTILDSYRRLSAGLIDALKRLGVDADIPTARTAPKPGESLVCFEVAADYEIAVRGRKLIGSAQMRRGGALLQHGSLPLTGDIAAICALLDYPDDSSRCAAADDLRRAALTLADAIGAPPDRGGVERALNEAFAAVFDVQLVPGSLDSAETQAAAVLSATHYGADSWIMRR